MCKTCKEHEEKIDMKPYRAHTWPAYIAFSGIAALAVIWVYVFIFLTG